MLELELECAEAVLEEFEGKVDKIGPFVNLAFSVPTTADVLAFFGPTLKEFYFDRHRPHLDLDDGWPVRDGHHVFPHYRDEEMGGANFQFGYGIGSPMVFTEAVVDKFAYTPKDGSRVVLELRVRVRATEEQVGKFYVQQKKKCHIKIEPGELPRAAA